VTDDRHRLDTDTLIPSSVLRILAHKYSHAYMCGTCLCKSFLFFFYTASRYSSNNVVVLIGFLNFRPSVRIHHLHHFDGFINDRDALRYIHIYITVSTRVCIHVRFRSDSRNSDENIKDLGVSPKGTQTNKTGKTYIEFNFIYILLAQS